MMKALLFSSLLLLLCTDWLLAQTAERDLPPATLIPHYRLAVGYNTTTVLVFSSAIRPVDRGDRDILATKQPGVDNVLKIKAGRRHFDPTNLHVFTADGRIYAFDVTYTDSLASSHDLTMLVPTPDASCMAPVVVLTGQLMDEETLIKTVATIRHLPTHRPLARDTHERMTMAVEDISQKGPLLFFRLRLTNRSNLSYPLNFVRCYIRDQQQTRRTSSQEQEILPIFQDSLAVIGGHTDQRLILALPAFTLANGKVFNIEAMEAHGGRSLAVRLHNRSLLRARPL